MTCADVERVLPEFLDGNSDGEFQDAFDIHLKSCPACSDLVSDLKTDRKKSPGHGGHGRTGAASLGANCRSIACRGVNR